MSYPQGPGSPYGQPYMQAPQHPQATTALVLGILSLVICAICGPFAWSIGKRAMNEIDASGGQIGGRGMAQAGYICGMIATILMILGLAFFVLSLAGAFGGLWLGSN